MLEVGANRVVRVFACDLNDTVHRNLFRDLDVCHCELEVEAFDPFKDLFFFLDLLSENVVAELFRSSAKNFDELVGLNLLKLFPVGSMVSEPRASATAVMLSSGFGGGAGGRQPKCFAQYQNVPAVTFSPPEVAI